MLYLRAGEICSYLDADTYDPSLLYYLLTCFT
jgi:hypothetical protein